MAFYWRLKGEVEFTTVARRTQFVAFLANYKSGKVTILDRSESMSDAPPIYRCDLALESDSDMQALWDSVKAKPTSGIVRMELCLHRCSCDTQQGDPVATNEYYRWP